MASYREWIEKVDIEIDYFSAFIRAWIAFNSWYRSEYSERTDRAIIDKIKDENNRFSTYIQNMLQGSDAISYGLQNDIGKLHEALINAAIVTQERGGIQKQITFSSIAISNPKNRVDNEPYRKNLYKLSRSNTQLEILITNKNTGAVIFNYTQDGYNEDELNSHSDFSRLGTECRSQCMAHYKSICPYITESLLTSSTDRLDLGGINFVNNAFKVSRGLIEILYLLRCALMHGEVYPDSNANEAYKYAYSILTSVLKKLI